MVRVTTPGICSAVKSRTRHVRRSLSGTSLDVRGSVVMEKVWMFEGMTEGISTEQLSEEDTGTDDWCPKHSWFLFTNLLTAQQCAKCLKRILPKRAAYKCTACKRLCHLKCAVHKSDSNSTGPTLRERKAKSTMDFENFVPKENTHSCRYTRKTSNRRYRSPYTQKEINDNGIEEMEIQPLQGPPIEQMNSLNARQQMAELSQYSDMHNTSRQSQARQKLTSMKHGFVKRCRSFRKKVKTLKDKVNHNEGEKESDEQTKQDSSTTTSSTLNTEEQVEQERQAWVRSPIRTRLRERRDRQLDLRRESVRAKVGARRNSSNGDIKASVKIIVTDESQMRNSRRHRFQMYDLQLVTLRDRVMEVEKRVGELETAIPQELEEWHKLKQKFRGEDNTDAFRRMETERALEEQIVHETHPKHIEAMGGMPSLSSGTTSDDVYIVPDHQGSSSQDEPDHVMPHIGHMTHSVGHMAHAGGHMQHSPLNSLRDDSLPSGIPSKLRLNIGTDMPGKLQTSTPVTERELSFLSASRQYRDAKQIHHTNITHINVEHSYCDPSLSSKTEVKLERSISLEKTAFEKVLSPEQVAVKSFLQKRRKSSPRKSGQMYTSPTRRKSKSPERMSPKRYRSPHNRTGSGSRSISPLQRTNHSSLYNSPPIASSTFQEENYGYRNMNPADISSPLSFTFRHDPGDNSQYSFAKIEENSKLEEARYNGEKNSSSTSNLSYTFRNDSQMIQTNAEEDLQGYARNLPPSRQQQSGSVPEEQSSDDNYPQATRMMVEADIEMDVPKSRVTFAKRGSMSTPLTTTTDDAMSLTNVTAFTGDFANSFAETVDSSNRSKWINKDVYMFDREHKGHSIRSRYAQSNEKVDATGDWRKPPIPGKRFSSTSEIDFLKEAEKRLEFYKIRKSGDEMTAGVCLEKLSRPSSFSALETDTENEVKEHFVRSYAAEQSVAKLQANPEYASPKHKSPFKGKRSGSRSRTPSPKRSRSPKRSPYLSRSSSPKQKSPKPRRSPRGSPKRKSLSPQRSPSSPRRTPVSQRSPSSQRRNISPNRQKHLSQKELQPNHFSPKHSQKVNSTSEFEDFERQLHEESLQHHRRSKSLTNLQRYQLPLPSDSRLKREISISCTNSVDGETRSIINESARYHFLHDKGMIKISSPSLKIMNGSPATRRKYEPEYKHIDEESSDMLHSGSESGLSGIYLDNNFHLHGKTSSEMDSKPTASEITGTETMSVSSSKSDSLKRKQRQERELFEQCLNTCDENQQVWDNVLDWMNKECDNNEECAELERELKMLMQQEDGELYNTEQEQSKKPNSNSPMEDSVYYSFQGQSEELQGALSPFRRTPVQRRSPVDKDLPDLMYVIRNGALQDIADYLNSDRTISEGEMKEAVAMAIEEQNYDVTLLLLEDICKLIQGAEGEMCVDVFPAYLEEHRWQPVFVVLTKQNFQGEWDSFMGFPVYRRRYDLVSTEAAVVINSEYVRSHQLSLDDFKTIRRALSSVNLQKYHRKITVVNACPCRSKKGGQVLKKGLCIVVHCLIKGFIPFDENPFPREINGIPVDVREGYFQPGVATPASVSDLHQQLWDLGVCNNGSSRSQTPVSSRESECQSGSGSNDENNNSCVSGSSSKFSSVSKRNVSRSERSPRTVAKKLNYLDKSKDSVCDQDGNSMLTDTVIDQDEGRSPLNDNKNSATKQRLQMGSSIGLHSGTGVGSIGGFVLLPDCDIGFLTCAHVFGGTSSEVDVYQSGCVKNDLNRTTCGMVFEKIYNPGSSESIGVDSAVVKVTARGPVDGGFVDIKREELERAGLDTQNRPHFAKGKILKLSDFNKEHVECNLVKVGAATGLTHGRLYIDGLYVKQSHSLDGEDKIELFNQFEVSSAPGSATRFFDFRDSGSLVFLAHSCSDLVCIGLAVGCTSYGSCVVTPVEAVLQALKLPEQFIDFTQCQSSF